MRLEESNIDPTKLYFHGTSGKIEKLKAPSAEKPFFVCSDIDYAYVMQKTLNTIGYDLIREKIVNVNEDEHSSFDKARDFIASLKRQFDDGEIVEMLPPIKEYLEKAVEITSKSRDAMSLVGQRLLD